MTGPRGSTRKRVAVVAAIVAAAMVLICVLSFLVSGICHYWGEEILESPSGVPFTPKESVEQVADDLKDE